MTLPLNSDRGEFSVRADAAYHSKWLTDQTWPACSGATRPVRRPTIVGFTMVPQDAYTLLNLRADWTNVLAGPIDVGLFVTNVTDEEVLLGGAGVNGMVTSSMAPPRACTASSCRTGLARASGPRNESGAKDGQVKVANVIVCRVLLAASIVLSATASAQVSIHPPGDVFDAPPPAASTRGKRACAPASAMWT